MQLRGAWLILQALMVIFVVNFAVGVLAAMGPDIPGSSLVIGLFADTLATASGQFSGRALRVMRT